MILQYEVRSLIDVIRLCSLEPTKAFITGQDELIESIYLGLPIRPVLVEKTASKWNLLTGINRMQIITNFYWSIFMVRNPQVVSYLDNQCYASLKNKGKFSNISLTCYFLPKVGKERKSVMIDMMERWG